jgi:hypothetical protein
MAAQRNYASHGGPIPGPWSPPAPPELSKAQQVALLAAAFALPFMVLVGMVLAAR